MANSVDDKDRESRLATEPDKYPLELTLRDSFLDGIAGELLKIANTTSVIVSFIGAGEWQIIAWGGQRLALTTTAIFLNFTRQGDLYTEIEDTFNYPLFKHNPALLSSPIIRFFSSTLVHDRAGLALFSLSALHKSPMRFTEVQRRAIRELTNEVIEYLKTKDKK